MNDTIEFIETSVFTRSYGAKAKNDDVLRELESVLAAAPELGPVIPGTNGCRKVRVGDAGGGRGKRGGWRIIYYVTSDRRRIHLIVAYAKTRKDDLTADDKAAMAALTKRIEVARGHR